MWVHLAKVEYTEMNIEIFSMFIRGVNTLGLIGKVDAMSSNNQAKVTQKPFISFHRKSANQCYLAAACPDPYVRVCRCAVTNVTPTANT